ncbi:MAG: HNH endonuclease [Deltaproteobacteria bacterium]|nr:HNH endonuclease [Deltaproteobacteria bacterium]
MLKICKYCNKEFNVAPCKIKVGKGKYCSMKCRSLDNSVEIICKKCGKAFRVSRTRYKNGRGAFCSKQCQYTWLSKQKNVLCDYCGKSFMAKMSELKRNKNHYCSRECCKKTLKGKCVGEKASGWKGGKQRERHNGNYKYSDWRLKIYERDNFTCQSCGQKGGKLNAHHQFMWSEYPSLRYELWNGITLCEECHKQEHKKIRKDTKCLM